MKTFTASLHNNRQIQIQPGEKFIPVVASSIKEILALLAAFSAATAIVLLSVWVSAIEMNEIIGASTWGLGFIFLGLAVDNHEPKAFFQLLTGVLLLVLAWLGSFVSPDFIIASGLLLATWVAVSLFMRLR